MMFSPLLSIAVGAAVAITPLGVISGAAVGLAMLLFRSQDDQELST